MAPGCVTQKRGAGRLGEFVRVRAERGRYDVVERSHEKRPRSDSLEIRRSLTSEGCPLNMVTKVGDGWFQCREELKLACSIAK